MPRWFRDLSVRVIEHVENHPTPFVRYLYLFFALLVVRLALEFFSSHRLFTLADVVHIGLWFAFIVLAFLVQLHLFSGERIVKVAKLAIVFYAFAWSAPILDLLTSGGVPARMSYLSLRSLPDIAFSYVTVGGSSMMRGATLGIRIEIVLLVLASFNYVWIKTGSALRAFFGAWSIYTVLFLSGAVPLLLGWLVGAFHLTYQPDDQSTLLLLLTADLALLFAALLRHRPRWIAQILVAVPWGVALLALLYAAIGACLAVAGYPGSVTLTPTTLFWFALLPALALCLATFAGLPRAVQSGADPEMARRTGNGLLLLILVIGAMLSPRLLFMSALLWGLLFLLNEAPARVTRVPLARNVLEAMLLASAALLGFVALGGPMVGFPRPWILCLLATAALGGLFADFGRTQGDIVPWLSTWPPERRRVFRGVATVSLLLAFALTAAVLVPATRDRVLLIACGLPPLALFWVTPKRTQWIAASLAAACGVLVRFAWS